MIDLVSGRFFEPQRLVLNQTRKRPVITEKMLSGTRVVRVFSDVLVAFLYFDICH